MRIARPVIGATAILAVVTILPGAALQHAAGLPSSPSSTRPAATPDGPIRFGMSTALSGPTAETDSKARLGELRDRLFGRDRRIDVDDQTYHVSSDSLIATRLRDRFREQQRSMATVVPAFVGLTRSRVAHQLANADGRMARNLFYVGLIAAAIMALLLLLARAVALRARAITQAQADAETMNRRLSLVVDQCPVTIVITDADGTIEYVNPKFVELTGYTESEVIGRNPRILKSGNTPKAVYDELWQTILRGDTWRGEFENRKRNGELFWEHAVISPITDDDGNITNFIGVKLDITDRKHLLSQLRESNERFELAVRGSQDGIWDWDLPRNRVFFSQRWKEMLGIDAAAEIDTPNVWYSRIASSHLSTFNQHVEAVVQGRTDEFTVELVMRHDDGSTRWMLCRAVAVRDDAGQATRLAGSMTDITGIKNAQNELERLACQDQLTGLANRAVFTERVEQAIARYARDPTQLYAVLFFDFDRFKLVNDSMGHVMGDALLRSIADRFRAHLRRTDSVARFGGDEFAVLLDQVADQRKVEQLANRLLDLFRIPHTLGEHNITCTTTIGIAVAHDGYHQPDEILRDADTALYDAKLGGKNRYKLFDEQLHSQVRERVLIEQELRAAVGTEQIGVYYQPIVALDDARLLGFEALVRWHHPTRGLVAPDAFIPIAEETGLIVALGEQVLEIACTQLRDWRAQFDCEHLFVAVNLSRRQLIQPDAEDTLREIVAGVGIDPALVHLEVTESTIMDQRHDMLDRLKRLRASGFEVLMDDFGTGYSSLSCLHQFPIQGLKLDRSFVALMDGRVDITAVVHAVVTLARCLHLDVIAEGLETRDQVATLQTLDCKAGQGFFFAKPMPADAATQYIAEHPLSRAETAEPVTAASSMA